MLNLWRTPSVRVECLRPHVNQNSVTSLYILSAAWKRLAALPRVPGNPSPDPLARLHSDRAVVRTSRLLLKEITLNMTEHHLTNT